MTSSNPYGEIKTTFSLKSPFLLVEGDIRGIQRYIYDVSSKGALRGFRARSFHLELLLEETADDLLQELRLPATQMLFSGGGHFHLLLPDTPSIRERLSSLRNSMSKRFWEREPLLSLAMVWHPLSWNGIKTSEGQQAVFEIFTRGWHSKKRRLWPSIFRLSLAFRMTATERRAESAERVLPACFPSRTNRMWHALPPRRSIPSAAS